MWRPLMGKNTHSETWWLDGPPIVHLVRMQVGDHDLQFRGQLHPRRLTPSTKAWPLGTTLVCACVCVHVRQGGWVFRVRRRHAETCWTLTWREQVKSFVRRKVSLKPFANVVLETQQVILTAPVGSFKQENQPYNAVHFMPPDIAKIFKPLKKEWWTMTLMLPRRKDKSYERQSELREAGWWRQ